MGSPPPKPLDLPGLLATAAPGITAAVELLTTTEVTDRREHAMQVASERAELTKTRAELARREAALARKEAELELERTRLREDAARLAQRTPTSKAGNFQPYASPAPPFAWPIYDLDTAGRWRLIVPERITYAWCVAFISAPAPVRAQVSRSRQSQYRRIARIPFMLGDKLDKAGIALRSIRFVAYAETFHEMHVRGQKLLDGERAPRRKPLDPDAPPEQKRGPGRPPLAPRAEPAPTPKPQEKSRDHARPKATRGRFERCLPSRKAVEQQRNDAAAHVLELAAQLARVNLASGKYDPDTATADDLTDEDDVGALPGRGVRPGEQG